MYAALKFQSRLQDKLVWLFLTKSQGCICESCVFVLSTWVQKIFSMHKLHIVYSSRKISEKNPRASSKDLWLYVSNILKVTHDWM